MNEQNQRIDELNQQVDALTDTLTNLMDALNRVMANQNNINLRLIALESPSTRHLDDLDGLNEEETHS